MADFEVNKENMIEFISGEHFCTVSFTNRKHINRIKRIYEDRKYEFKYFHENTDGSIWAKIPLKWCKINPGAIVDPNKPKRTRTPEQIEAATKALAEWRKKNKK